MPMSAHDVTPNRSVLLDLTKKIKLTQSGYKIMKMKRDGLIIEFFEVLEKARKMREGVSADYDVAMEKIQARFDEYAAGRNVECPVFHFDDTKFISVYSIPVPIPYIVCYKEVSLSATIKTVKGGKETGK